jgi:hypothetical protein
MSQSLFLALIRTSIRSSSSGVDGFAVICSVSNQLAEMGSCFVVRVNGVLIDQTFTVDVTDSS